VFNHVLPILQMTASPMASGVERIDTPSALRYCIHAGGFSVAAHTAALFESRQIRIKEEGLLPITFYS
jgi:hypothetical protein